MQYVVACVPGDTETLTYFLPPRTRQERSLGRADDELNIDERQRRLLCGASCDGGCTAHLHTRAKLIRVQANRVQIPAIQYALAALVNQ